MKKLIMTTLATLALIQSAHAFQVQANVQINGVSAMAYVQNNYNRPIVCNIEATGVLYSGHYIYSYGNQIVIYPGQYGNTYVYSTNRHNPLVNAYANADCYWY
ncbi:MAG: hypothetical protein EP326_09300 [Deltaproteobacteria bacterium]|nr:MAG: hypothetical protein EP326_09300 [Deltaproteobacteria bacterium]